MEDHVISPEKVEEAKLKARYPNLVSRPGGSDLLRKRLQKGVSHLRIVCSIFTVPSGCNVNGPPWSVLLLLLNWQASYTNSALAYYFFISNYYYKFISTQCSLKTHWHMNILSIHTENNTVLMWRGTIEKMIFVWRNAANCSVQK